MKLTIEISDQEIENLVKEIFQNYPEYSSGNVLKCVVYNYDKFLYTFQDTESGVNFTLILSEAVRGWGRFAEAVARGSLHFEGLDTQNLLDPCAYDAVSLDAVVQMAIYGDLVYS